MKKSVIKSIFMLSVLLVLTGMITLRECPPAHAATQQYLIKFAHVDPADVYTSKKHAQGIAFKTLVESKSGGRIKVEIYPAGQLGSEREVLEQTRGGVIQMTSTGDGPVPGHFKEIMVLGIPYLFKSEPIAWAVFDGPFGREISEAMRVKTGLRILAYGETGFRNFTNSKHPIKSPEDVKGLKFRVMDNPMHIQMVKLMGGYPTPIDWKEVYGALQTKVVDGQENPVSVLIYGKLYEVQKYLTLDGHLYTVDFIFINDKFYTGLPKDLQKILKDSAIMAGTVSRGIQQLSSCTGIDTIKSKGMEIYSPTAEDLVKFRKVVQEPITEMIRKEVGKEWVDKLLKAVSNAEAELDK